MTRGEIQQAVLDALWEVVPEARGQPIDAAAPLRDQVDLDSMDFINFVVGLDEALGVNVPEADYGHLRSLKGCVDYLEGRLGGATPRPRTSADAPESEKKARRK